MNSAECGIKFILLNLNCASFYLYDAFGSVRVWDEENDLVHWYKYIIITMVHLFWLWVYRLNWIQLRKTHWFDTFIFKSFKWETNCTIQKTCKLHLKNNDFLKKFWKRAKRLCNFNYCNWQRKTFYYCPFDLYVWHFEFQWKYLETLKLSRHCHKKYFAKKIWCNRAASSKIFKKRKI